MHQEYGRIMSKLDAIEKKLAQLESRFYSGQVRSIDDHRQEVWIKGSGLEFMRTVLKAKRALGKEALPKDPRKKQGSGVGQNCLPVDYRIW